MHQELYGLKILVIVKITMSLCMTASSFGTEVSCLFKQSCILPCSLKNGDELLLHWCYMKGDLNVHSFYQNQDQLGNQNPRFKGRTSLFNDQIPKPPVSKVSISQVENMITCSSEGTYPQPELTWSIIPPSNTSLQNRTTVHQNEEQLYNISSSLMVSDNNTDLIYSCTIRTRRNKKRATVRKLSATNVTYSETTIPCFSYNTSTTSLTWRFNQHQIILNQTETKLSPTVSEAWRKHVKEVSESGSLTLQDMTSDQEGVYTCELSNEDETMITNISVRISQVNPALVEGIIIGGVVTILSVATILMVKIWQKCKKS